LFDRLVQAWLDREEIRWFDDPVVVCVSLDEFQVQQGEGDEGDLAAVLAGWC